MCVCVCVMVMNITIWPLSFLAGLNCINQHNNNNVAGEWRRWGVGEGEKRVGG